MKRLAATIMLLSVFARVDLPPRTAKAQADVSRSSSPMDSGTIQITRSGTQRANKGSAERFTGSVMVEEMFPSHDPSRTSGGKVTFEPGARSAWHTHPLGQILIVTNGTGWIQAWDGPVEKIRKGDVVWIPPGVKHWHGATPKTAMTHIAIHEQRDGKVV